MKKILLLALLLVGCNSASQCINDTQGHKQTCRATCYTNVESCQDKCDEMAKLALSACAETYKGKP